MKIFKKLICLCLTLGLLLGGCNTAGGQGSTTSYSEPIDLEAEITQAQIQQEDDVFDTRLMLITNVDYELSQIVLQDMESYRQLLYSYNLNTRFTDKNGEYVSITGFTPGRIVELNRVNEVGVIEDISLSDKVWEYSDITNYNIDRDRGVFTIGNTNYRISEDVPVFSGDTPGLLSDLGKTDELRVTGQDKDVWAITITTGHGILSIINTSVFNNSLICIGNLYTLVKGDMQLESPEGTYTVTVANNGYGGSSDVTIVKNEVYTLDLDTLKGEGRRTCDLTLKVSVPGAVIRVDGNVVPADTVSQISYGRHNVSVEAEGYENWSKTLYVNSPTATIVLDMTEDKDNTSSSGSSSATQSNNNQTDTATDSNDAEDSDIEDKADDSSESEDSANNSGNSQGATTEAERQEAQLDYLTTISNMVTSLFSN